MKKIIVLYSLLTFSLFIQAQIVQVVKGYVFDKDSKVSLPGVSVCLYQNNEIVQCTSTDESGFFKLNNIPIGRYGISATFLGFKPYVNNNLQVNSGKEISLNIYLEETVFNLGPIEIKSERTNDAGNKMALISARSFNTEETERYAGSRNDPARMASNYAGVRGADDSRNDIIIRGNSPLGLLWQLENIPIPNPNHFAIFGSTGGPVSILNNKTLSNSDFFTGAFPAQYGNALAGVFDLKLRNGNFEKHEQTFQLGLIGAEAMIEGPISKKSGASYLATYRYSTLELMKSAGINFGVSAIPKFQDGTFKIHMPVKKGSLSLFGVAGKSDIYFKDSERDTTTWSFGDAGKDVYFGSSMAVVGANYIRFINSKSYLRLVASTDYSMSYSTHNMMRDTNDYTKTVKPYPFLRNKSKQYNTNIRLVYNTKLSAKHTFQAGLLHTFIHGIFTDSIYKREYKAMQERFNVDASTQLSQAYIMWKWKWNDKNELVSGVHTQYFLLTNEIVFEPRIAWRYSPDNLNSFSLAYGLHHQNYPMYVYFGKVNNEKGEYGEFNKNLKFTRSNHLVAGYKRILNEATSLKLEVYYQKLDKIPVLKDSASSYSLINQGTGFTFIRPEYALENKGVGYNTGIELTLERSFYKGWFYLITGSLYDSKYKATDNKWYNTGFNGKFTLNALGGKMFRVGSQRKNLINAGAKITWAGGNPYTPFDITKSDFFEVFYIDSLAYSKRYKNYFRFDIKITYVKNKRNHKSEWGFDLINILNIKNVLTITYNPFTKEPVEEKQLGFLPVIYYRIEF
jgi:hypothetical protein